MDDGEYDGLSDAEREQERIDEELETVRDEANDQVGAIDEAVNTLDNHLIETDPVAVEQDVEDIHRFVHYLLETAGDFRRLVHAAGGLTPDRLGVSTLPALPLHRANPLPERPTQPDDDDDDYLDPAREWLNAAAHDLLQVASDVRDGMEAGLPLAASGTDGDMAAFVEWSEQVSQALDEAHELWVLRLVKFADIAGGYPGWTGEVIDGFARWLRAMPGGPE